MLKKEINLLCITCQRDDVSYEQQVKLACEGGADMIQFRDKVLSDRVLLETALNLKKICNDYNVYFTMNNRIDIADIVEADGVHIGPNDLPISYARKILSTTKIVGVSASNCKRVLEISQQNIDYIGCGAMYPTNTKPEAKLNGLNILREIKQLGIKVPIIAIGGINKTNVADVMNAGADGVAVVSSVCGAKDIKKEAQIIKEIILNNKGKIQ